MAAVTLEELVEEVGILEESLDQEIPDDHLGKIAQYLDWRAAAPHLGLAEAEIEALLQADQSEREKRMNTLLNWRGRVGSQATYRRLVEALLSAARADHAEEVCWLLNNDDDEMETASSEGAGDGGLESDGGMDQSPPASPQPSPRPFYYSYHRQTEAERKMEAQINDLERFFDSVVDKAAEGLENSSISLYSLKRCITQLPASHRHLHVRFLAGNLAAINKAESVGEVFSILGLYWDFMNCGLLERVVERFGDQATKDLLQKYLDKLRNFRLATKVRDFVDNWMHGLHPQFSALSAEMENEWMERTLEDLELFRNEVSRQFAFESYSLQFKKAKTGSVIIVYGLQRSFPMSVVARQTAHMHKFLLQNSIRKMFYKGVCIFDCKLDVPEMEETQPVEPTKLIVQPEKDLHSDSGVAFSVETQTDHEVPSVVENKLPSLEMKEKEALMKQVQQAQLGIEQLQREKTELSAVLQHKDAQMEREMEEKAALEWYYKAHHQERVKELEGQLDSVKKDKEELQQRHKELLAVLEQERKEKELLQHCFEVERREQQERVREYEQQMIIGRHFEEFTKTVCQQRDTSCPCEICSNGSQRSASIDSEHYSAMRNMLHFSNMLEKPPVRHPCLIATTPL